METFCRFLSRKRKIQLGGEILRTFRRSRIEERLKGLCFRRNEKITPPQP